MFNKIFGSNKDKSEDKKEQPVSKLNWIPLTSIEEIENIKEISKTKPVGVFKHSTRCVISKTVLDRFEDSFPENASVALYYIDLLNNRDVSSEIGIAFQVLHQSPQFLLIRNETAVSHASHYDILEMDFESLLK